jgi:hypothetical protein
MAGLALTLGVISLFAAFFFWLGWKWRGSVDARRRYRESHPRYLHSGGNRELS